MLKVLVCCWKSLTSTRNKVNSQYISGCKLHLTNQFCVIELGLKFTSNIVISLSVL